MGAAGLLANDMNSKLNCIEYPRPKPIRTALLIFPLYKTTGISIRESYALNHIYGEKSLKSLFPVR